MKAVNQLDGTSFNQEDLERIRAEIKKKYASVSRSAKGYFKYPVGREGALLLGYDKTLLEEISDRILCSFCGVGNPHDIEKIDQGSIVLDIGCGAGVDLYVCSRQVGDAGKVYGIDLTPEMVATARENLEELGAENVAIKLVTSDKLPVAEDSIDVVISNGVFNLSPDKQGLFKEIHRVLKPGGRLQFADIILDKALPPGLGTSVTSWSQ